MREPQTDLEDSHSKIEALIKSTDDQIARTEALLRDPQSTSCGLSKSFYQKAPRCGGRYRPIFLLSRQDYRKQQLTLSYALQRY